MTSDFSHWVQAKRLAFSALSPAGRAARIIKHLAWLAAVVTAASDFSTIWGRLQALSIGPVTHEALLSFLAANGRVAACLVVSVASWFVDIRLSRSILEEIRARDFYGKDGFKDIVERLNEQEKTIGARVDELDRTPGWTQPSVNKALLLRAASRQPLKFSIADKTWELTKRTSAAKRSESTCCFALWSHVRSPQASGSSTAARCECAPTCAMP